MSSTNKTINYNLSQFVGTDIPSILNDYNGDMQKIDTAVHNVSVASGDNASDIASLQSTVSGHTNQIAQIDSNVTSVSGRVLTVEGKVTNIENVIPDNASVSNKLITSNDIGSIQEQIDNINTSIENVELCIPSSASSVNQLVTKNVLNSAIESVEEYGHRLIASVTKNDDETLASMLYRLSEVLNDIDDIQISNLKIMFSDGTIGHAVNRTLSPLSVTFVVNAKRSGVVTNAVPIGYSLFNMCVDEQSCFAYSLLDAIFIEGSHSAPTFQYSDLTNSTNYSSIKLYS